MNELLKMSRTDWTATKPSTWRMTQHIPLAHMQMTLTRDELIHRMVELQFMQTLRNLRTTPAETSWSLREDQSKVLLWDRITPCINKSWEVTDQAEVLLKRTRRSQWMQSCWWTNSMLSLWIRQTAYWVRLGIWSANWGKLLSLYLVLVRLHLSYKERIKKYLGLFIPVKR